MRMESWNSWPCVFAFFLWARCVWGSPVLREVPALCASSPQGGTPAGNPGLCTHRPARMFIWFLPFDPVTSAAVSIRVQVSALNLVYLPRTETPESYDHSLFNSEEPASAEAPGLVHEGAITRRGAPFTRPRAPRGAREAPVADSTGTQKAAVQGQTLPGGGGGNKTGQYFLL